jgi:hypothetical protein
MNLATNLADSGGPSRKSEAVQQPISGRWQRWAVTMAWAFPVSMLVNFVCSILLNPDGWLILNWTVFGQLIYGIAMLILAFLAAKERSWKGPVSRVLVAGIVVTMVMSLFAPLRFALAGTALVLTVSPSILLAVDGRGSGGQWPVLVTFIALIFAAAFLAKWVDRGGIQEDAVIQGPIAGLDFVFHDGDEGALGGGTTGYARVRLLGVAQLQMRLYDGSLGARPVVKWVNWRSLSIDGKPVDLWNGPFITGH